MPTRSTTPTREVDEINEDDVGDEVDEVDEIGEDEDVGKGNKLTDIIKVGENNEAPIRSRGQRGQEGQHVA